MSATGYVTLSRQSALLREMQVVANNIANASTTGYRQEGLVFSEFIRAAQGAEPLSMSQARVRNTSMLQGALAQTGGTFDVAIEGEGFFMVETPDGPRLTRAGAFAPDANGDLVSPDGYKVLDEGGAPIFVPPDASNVRIGPDGTISAGDRALGRIGVFLPDADSQLVREDGVLFRVEGDTVPADDVSISQGAVEESNVDAVGQIGRMIEIQRAYELGQSFLDAEDRRIRDAVKALLR